MGAGALRPMMWMRKQVQDARGLRLWLESVADPGVGDEVFGLCVVGFEFAAYVAHVDAQKVLIGFVIGAPHGDDQLFVGDELLRVTDEVDDDRPLRRGQSNLGLLVRPGGVHEGTVGGEVEVELTGSHDGEVVCRVW